MANNSSSDNSKPEIFKRASDALQRDIERNKPRPDPAPRKEPTAK